MYYGGDYNPEQWPESVWLDDVARMAEAKVNLVTVGVFAWSRLQPAEGQFDFGWLDKILDLMHEHRIGVDLATATASPPPWMSTRYPDTAAVDDRGSRFWPGSRQHQAPASPQYRRLAGDLVSQLAQRYAEHPAVVMWHINNEYGCHLSYDYSEAAAVAFRGWLQRRYGSSDELNRAWGTQFWSQIYQDFNEVNPPRQAPYSQNPTQLLDFARFSSDMMLECLQLEKKLIRSAGATQPITTNFMGLHRSTDYWAWADELDVISDDCYPDPADPVGFRRAALQRDLMRSLKPDTPWLLMEQAANALNWRTSNASRPPGQLAALSAQAVGRGADAVMFFQWRQSRAGAEKFHSAMLPQAGTDTRSWHEVVELGGWLQQLPALPAGRSGASVAIVLDWPNWWAVENPDHPTKIDYPQQLHTWYEAFHRLHLAVDFVPPTGDLSTYRLVLAPQLYLLTTGGAANLNSFVDNGGHLLVGAFSDVVNENDHFRDGGFLTQLRDMLGVELLDFGALSSIDPSSGVADVSFDLEGSPLSGHLLAEEVRVTDARVMAAFTSGDQEGQPALTRAIWGAGTAYYLATLPYPDSAVDLARWLARHAAISPVLDRLPEMVEAARRGDVVTLINHGPETVDVSLTGRNLVTDTPVGHQRLDPQEVFMYRPVAADSASAVGPLNS